jgi:hypothetical protein
MGFWSSKVHYIKLLAANSLREDDTLCMYLSRGIECCAVKLIEAEPLSRVQAPQLSSYLYLPQGIHSYNELSVSETERTSETATTIHKFGVGVYFTYRPHLSQQSLFTVRWHSHGGRIADDADKETLPRTQSPR